VIQSAPDRVLVRIQLRDTASADRFAGEEVIAGISGVFDAYSCERPLVTIAFEKPQFNPNSSKLIRIQRTFKLDSHDDR
jgi:hypothetical protein